MKSHLSNTVALSTGQKQLLCLARAVLTNSKILVIDEATAYVDYQIDKFIQDTIKLKFEKSTIITIAHRLSTLRDYDKIIVMDGGSIIKIGTPAEIIVKQEEFELRKPIRHSSVSESSQLISVSAAISRDISRTMSRQNTISNF